MADRPDAVTPHPASLSCSQSGPMADGRHWPFDDRWRTEVVVGLARGIRAEQAFDRMPILADALEEAGCHDRAVLDHCRACPNHVMGCWVVEAVLDFDPPSPAPPPPTNVTRVGRILEGMRKEMRILPTPAEISADGPETPERKIARVGCVALVMLVFVAVCVLMAPCGVR